MIRDAAVDALKVGGNPQVDLLPPEVRKERRAKAWRRRLGGGVIGVVVVAVLGVGAATALAIQAEARLAVEQARTGQLIAEEATYADVRAMQNQVDLVRAAQEVGASTEIDWKTYLDAVQGTLPASVAIVTVSVDSASPLMRYAQSTAPLQGARVATVGFTATSTVLPDVPTWLTALGTLPGFADALPGSVTLNESDGTYTVAITMHINDAAFAQRFTGKGK